MAGPARPGAGAWFRPRIASAAARARASVSWLVSWLRLMACRESSTAVSFAAGLPVFVLVLAALAAAVLVPVAGAGEGGVVDPPGYLLIVLLAEQGEVVDAGGAGGIIAGQGLGAGLGVSVPGDVRAGSRSRRLSRRTAPTARSGKRVEDELDRAARPAPGRPGSGCRAWTPSRSWRPSAILTSGTHQPGRRATGRGTGRRLPDPGQRSLPGLGMLPDVVDRFCPGGEQPVQLRQVRDLRGAVPVSSARNWPRTVLKNLSIFPLPSGRPGWLCTSLMPRCAQARSSHASTNAEPLST